MSSREEELERRHQEMNRKIGVSKPQPSASDGPPSDPAGGGGDGGAGGGQTKTLIMAIMVLFILGTGVAFYLVKIADNDDPVAGDGPAAVPEVITTVDPIGGGDPDTMLAQAAERYSSAVALVVAVKRDAPQPIHIPFATAWAYSPNEFGTNAHVVDAARDFAAKGFTIEVGLNRKRYARFPVIEMARHDLYQSIDPKSQKVMDVGYDVGILRIEGMVDTYFPIASEEELRKLDSGYRVASLGYPMERMKDGGVNSEVPVANMQSGIVTAVSDFEQMDSGYNRNLLVRINLGAVGGSSGSPIFNTRGEVVAILNAGNVFNVLIPTNSGDVGLQRVNTGALVNFAQRVDILSEVRF